MKDNEPAEPIPFSDYREYTLRALNWLEGFADATTCVHARSQLISKIRSFQKNLKGLGLHLEPGKGVEE